jgi:hypothetical protein
MISVKTRNEALESGFATFNGGKHICVDLQDADQTISVRTPDGNLITFAFVPRPDKGFPGHQCVDIQHHTPSTFTRNGSRDVPVQTAALYGCGPTNARCGVADDSPTTLITLLLPEK